jgi:hypothetical protein
MFQLYEFWNGQSNANRDREGINHIYLSMELNVIRVSSLDSLTSIAWFGDVAESVELSIRLLHPMSVPKSRRGKKPI